MSLHIAKVVDVHPEGNTIDVTFAADGRWVPGIPVIGSALSGNTGLVDLPVPDLTTPRSYPENHKSLNTDKRDMMAIIGDVDGAFVCLGFVPPPVCEMNFPKEIGEERRIDRHASDVYSTIDKKGNAEWFHPSGTYVRIAEDVAHEDLTAKDYDKIWAIKRNVERSPSLRIQIKDNAGVHVTLTMRPDGTVSLVSESDISVESGGDISVTAGGDVSINAAAGVTVSSIADLTVTSASMISIAAPVVDLLGAVSINGIVQVGN